MHVVVVAKNTPDTAATVTVTPDGKADWGKDLVINPWDEYAVTEAVLLQAAHKVKVTIMAVGPEAQNEALKHGLAIGCDQAIRLWDEALVGADSLAVAQVIAAAVKKLGDVDLLIFGKEFSDVASEAHVFQAARKLGWNAVGFVAQIAAIDFGAKTLRVRRQAEGGTETIAATLPAVISVVKDINKPKYPTLIGIRKAAKADLPVWGLGDLGLSAEAVRARTRQERYQELPRREGAAEIIDGPTAQAKAEALVARLIEEKVL